MNRLVIAARLLLPLALCQAAAPAVTADDDGRILLASEASGILELEGENRFVIDGSNMTLSIRVGREGELRFAARARTNRREERPVELWLEDRTLSIRRVEGDASEPLVVEVALSPGLRVDATMSDSAVTINSVQGRVDLEGRNLEVTVNAPGEPITLELEDSTLTARNLYADLDLTATRVEGSVDRVRGYVSGTLTDSSISFDRLEAGTELELENSAVNLATLSREVRLHAAGGTLGMSAVQHGAEIVADETVIQLDQTEGDVVVETNAELRFSQIGGNLTINSYGAKVIGSGVAGTLRISGTSSEIAVEGLAGVSRIDGSDLSISAKSMQADLDVVTSASTMIIEDAGAGLTIQSEFGDVAVLRAGGQVKIDSRDGNVTVAGQSGGLEIKADGPTVEVSWTQLARDKNASIENKSGDVRLTFPPRAQGRVEAEASYGSVESSLAMVRVLEDGKSASGVLGRSNQPMIQVKAGNTVYLGSIDPADTAGE